VAEQQAIDFALTPVETCEQSLLESPPPGALRLAADHTRRLPNAQDLLIRVG
jgi:hypothetical protein